MDELQKANQTIVRLMTHCQELAEQLWQVNVDTLAQIRRINMAYKQHADLMSAIDEGMKEYVDRDTSES